VKSAERIVQIVPHLPPPYEGLGGSALALAGALNERFGDCPAFVEARALPARRPADLAAALEETDRVLLHYANYGYERRGCPVWLVKGLARWRRRREGRRLVTLFHEVYASGPPWRSSFWLGPIQRRLAAEMVRGSDGLATPLPLYAGLLQPWTAGREVLVMPVFSNVGEPAAVPGLEQRARRILVFGGAGVRSRAYGPFLPVLAAAARALEAEEILDVGPDISLPASAGGVPIQPRGALPKAEVSELLLGSAAGFLCYPPRFLPKSGVFAAYCAHGVLPICAWDHHPTDEAPAAGRHYWNGEGATAAASGTDSFQAIADAARAWYAGHSLARQAAAFHDLLVEKKVT
jgi:hypothetical protein